MVWPASSAERDRFVLERRPARPALDPWRIQGVTVDDEPGPTGERHAVATFFLTGRECPWRCAMCDLWQHTITADTPPTAIPRQIADGCRVLSERGGGVTRVKLYNAGSFFDPRAVPETDYPAIATALRGFRRVIVESHPALVGARTVRFQRLLAPTLEVAIGLETAHPDALARLHKRMDVPSFEAAAATLRACGIRLRVFLLIAPPFVPAGEQDDWLRRSIDIAIGAGASVISLIPTRTGNGTLEALALEGLFQAPTVESITRSVALARAHAGRRAVLLLDPWNGTGIDRALA